MASALDAFIPSAVTSGLSGEMLLVESGQVILQKTYGFADREARRSFTNFTERRPKSRRWDEYQRMPPPQVDKHSLHDYVGTYVSVPLAAVWCLTLSGSHLVLHGKGFEDLVPEPIGRDAFVLADWEAQFERRDGSVTDLFLVDDRVSHIGFRRESSPQAPDLCTSRK
jgi:hypothetical protein